MSKAVVIVNPTSGREEGREYGPAVKEELENLYDEVELKWTEKAGDATAFANQAAKEGVDAVYALGGDGTVNECVSGIAPEPVRPAFGFIPLGTVNDLGRVLDIPMNPKKAIRQLTHRRKKTIDIGKINDKYFIDIVAIGSIPEAVHDVPIEKKTKLGPFAYLIEGAKAIAEKEVYPFRFTLEDETAEVDSFLVLIALTNSVAGIQTMIPEASVDDGYLHLAAVKGNNLAEKLNLVPKIFAGKVTEDESVFYRKFKKGTIELRQSEETEEVITNVDGDKGDALPITLEVLTHHIDVFIPEDAEVD